MKFNFKFAIVVLYATALVSCSGDSERISADNAADTIDAQVADVEQSQTTPSVDLETGNAQDASGLQTVATEEQSKTSESQVQLTTGDATEIPISEMKSTEESIPPIRIEPSKPKSQDTIFAVFDNSISSNVTFNWYKNKTIYATTLQPILDKPVLRDDIIYVEASFKDGSRTISSRSSEVLVGNTPPTAENIEILPSNPTSADVFYSDTSGISDVDGDDLQYSYIWRSTNSDSVLSREEYWDPRFVDEDLKYYLEIIVSDGFDETIISSESVKIKQIPFNTEFQPQTIYHSEETTFKAYFGNSDQNFPTELSNEPSGISYVDNWVNWTPQSFMFKTTETFFISFRSDEARRNETMEIVVENPTPASVSEIPFNTATRPVDIVLSGDINSDASELFIKLIYDDHHTTYFLDDNRELIIADSDSVDTEKAKYFENCKIVTEAPGSVTYCFTRSGWPDCPFRDICTGGGWVELSGSVFDKNLQVFNEVMIWGDYCENLVGCVIDTEPTAIAYAGNGEYLVASKNDIKLVSLRYSSAKTIYSSKPAILSNIADMQCKINVDDDTAEYCVIATTDRKLFVLE